MNTTRTSSKPRKKYRIRSIKCNGLWVILVIVILSGCGIGGGAAPSDFPELLTGYDGPTEIFIDPRREISFQNPAHLLATSEENTIIIAESDSPNDLLLCPDQICITIYTMEPYLDRFSRRFRIPRSPLVVLRTITRYLDFNSDWKILEPATQVNINGRNGAIHLAESNYNTMHYTVSLGLADNKTVILNASGPAEMREQMIDELNAIALSVESLGD